MDRTDQVIAGVTAGIVLVAGAGYFYEKSQRSASVTPTVRHTIIHTRRVTSRRTTTAVHTVLKTASATSTPSLTRQSALRAITLGLTVNGSQFRTNEAVTMTLTATPAITNTGSIMQLVDTTTGRVVGVTGYGSVLSVTATHGTTTTRSYQGRLLRQGVVVAQSNPVSVTWQDTANGSNVGYTNAAGGSVILHVYPYTQAGKPGLMMHLQPEVAGITNPVYSYWWLPPGGAWTSNGGYKNLPNLYLDANVNGVWSFTVYATDGTAPHPETTAQRAIYEAKSDTILMGVTNAPTTAKRYTSRAPGAVAVSVPASVAIGQTITIRAQASGITNPVYQFWWETPSGQWQSDGVYHASDSWPVAMNALGLWHIVVVARSASAPQNEDAQQRALYEVSSPVSVVSVHTAALPQ